ncbi:hypothetical protein TNCV_1977851 [Trichonephila clavipes]|nr:hypothetical protein TNCV_1977851 [Trichonephila clavipes]
MVLGRDSFSDTWTYTRSFRLAELHEGFWRRSIDVILNHDRVTWTTPELAPPIQTTTPTGGRLRSRHIQPASLFYMGVFICTGVEFGTRPTTIQSSLHLRDLDS